MQFMDRLAPLWRVDLLAIGLVALAGFLASLTSQPGDSATTPTSVNRHQPPNGVGVPFVARLARVYQDQ